ncbi:MAG: DUF4845 domain-containing protein [Pseudomonadota bacterium]
MRNRERGLSFFGLLIVGGLVACIGVLGAQALPTVIEYQAILKAVNKASAGSTVAEVRKIFESATAIDDITSVAPKDLVVTKEGDKVIVSFAYNREIPVAGPVFLVIKYAGRSR